MSSIVTLDLPLAGRLRTYFWEHPEWWTRVLCGAAWALMLFHGWQDPGA